MQARKTPLLVLLGPTAVGKTALSLQLAERLGTEIISGDSMLVYRGFDIGSAKPRAMEHGTMPYDALVIGLMRERAHLYARINERVEAMFAAGLCEEVQQLLDSGVRRDAPAMKGIGYKETAAYLAGEITRAEAITAVQTATRHFAKRQLTWYRQMPYIRWYDADAWTEPELLERILMDIKEWQTKGEAKDDGQDHQSAG